MPSEIPSGWTTVLLGEVAARVHRRVTGVQEHVLMITSAGGFVPQSDKYDRFMAGESLARYTDLHRDEFAYNKGNSKTYPYGCVFQLDEYPRAAVPNVYISFAVDSTRLDHGFAKHLFGAGWLNGHLARVISSGVRGNGLLNVAPDDFFAAPLPRPPLPEQKKIAAILSSLDEAIQATQAVIDQTRRVKEGLLQDLLTRGIGDTRLKQTEIGEIPDAWSVSRLGDCAEVTKLAGFEYTSHFDYSIGGDVIAVRALNLRDGSLDLADVQTIPEAVSDALPRSKLKEGDIVFTYVGVNVGQSALVPAGRFHLAPNVARVTALAGLESAYLQLFLQSSRGQRQVMRLVSTTSQPSLSMGNLRQIVLAIPPLDMQRQIVASLVDIQESSMRSQSKVARLTCAKNGLLQDLLTGRVRVTP